MQFLSDLMFVHTKIQCDSSQMKKIIKYSKYCLFDYISSYSWRISWHLRAQILVVPISAHLNLPHLVLCFGQWYFVYFQLWLRPKDYSEFWNGSEMINSSSYYMNSKAVGVRYCLLIFSLLYLKAPLDGFFWSHILRMKNTARNKQIVFFAESRKTVKFKLFLEKAKKGHTGEFLDMSFTEN